MLIQRAGDKIVFLGGSQIRVVSPRGGAAAVSWWLSGGIAAANCLAAYAAKGAASLAASYVNLANPGTYNLAYTGSGLTWDAVNGWIDATGNAVLTATGLTVTNNQTWSVLCKFTNLAAVANCCLCSNGNTLQFAVRPIRSGTDRRYVSGDQSSILVGQKTTGVMGIAGRQPYYNGAADGALITAGVGTNGTYLALHGSAAGLFGYYQANALYNITLSAAQMLAVSTAMAAL
ncbi:hypothetical protein [Candidatus Magnetobacterium casense]|uniref:Uncharacterized protein n=1 Tax=Candidatus Magnetobacterium casense TaxID=1455061 RepID=A0ABS6S4C3_9BACT|nr:hypothetical protein [Candidatus Magnetobacterium casensis]MBV6343492.1 hypothetical protein [Candidatus Magnetobacterium casensis]